MSNFEQSLASMAQRLQSLTVSAAEKVRLFLRILNFDYNDLMELQLDLFFISHSIFLQ